MNLCRNNIVESPLFESELLQKLQANNNGHPNILHHEKSFMVDEKLHVGIFELWPEDLFSHVSNREAKGNRLSLEEVSYHFNKILQGTNHLHERLIAHLDIALENVLLAPTPSRFHPHSSAPGSVLCDLGQAVQLLAADDMLPGTREFYRGRTQYMAPEIFSGKSYNAFKVFFLFFFFSLYLYFFNILMNSNCCLYLFNRLICLAVEYYSSFSSLGCLHFTSPLSRILALELL